MKTTTSAPTFKECPICGGLGYILRRAENGELFSRECKCEIIRQNQRRISRSGLEPLIEHCTFEKFETPEKWQMAAKEAAETYVKDFHEKWFFIGGDSGTGKTHLCTAVCSQLMDAGIPVRYMQWRSEIPGIKAKINDVEAYEDATRPLKSIRALYIDDFLKGNVTEGDRNLSFDILNSRYNNPQKITIISSERRLDDILNWDEAIGSRIAERAKGYIFNITGKSNWRLK